MREQQPEPGAREVWDARLTLHGREVYKQRLHLIELYEIAARVVKYGGRIFH